MTEKIKTIIKISVTFFIFVVCVPYVVLTISQCIDSIIIGILILLCGFIIEAVMITIVELVVYCFEKNEKANS